MHELSIAMSLVDMAQEEVERSPGHVLTLHVRLGPLSGVFKDALMSSYEMASYDTPLQGSQLVIEDVPIVIYCLQCQGERTVDSVQWLCCPVCSTPAAQILHGRELELASMEIET